MKPKLGKSTLVLRLSLWQAVGLLRLARLGRREAERNIRAELGNVNQQAAALQAFDDLRAGARDLARGWGYELDGEDEPK